MPHPAFITTGRAQLPGVKRVTASVYFRGHCQVLRGAITADVPREEDRVALGVGGKRRVSSRPNRGPRSRYWRASPALTEGRRPRRRGARLFEAGEGEVRGKKHNGPRLAMTSWVARAGIAPARAVIYVNASMRLKCVAPAVDRGPASGSGWRSLTVSSRPGRAVTGCPHAGARGGPGGGPHPRSRRWSCR
jgi:hypothetical protein